MLQLVTFLLLFNRSTDVDDLPADALLSMAGISVETIKRGSGKGSYKVYHNNSGVGSRKFRSLKQAVIAAKDLLRDISKEEGKDEEVTDGMSAKATEPTDITSGDDVAEPPENRPSVTLESMLANQLASSNVTKIVASAEHPNKIDTTVAGHATYVPYYPARRVTQEVDDHQFSLFEKDNRLVPYDDGKQECGLASVIANYYCEQGINSLGTPEKLCNFLNFSIYGKSASKYSTEAVSVLKEFLEEQKEGAEGNFHSIAWYHTLLQTVSLITLTEVVLILPPDGRCVKNGSRIITFPESDVVTNDTGIIGMLVVRLIVDYSKLSGWSDDGDIASGVVAYYCDFKNDPNFFEPMSVGTGAPSELNSDAFVYKTPDKPDASNEVASLRAQLKKLEDVTTIAGNKEITSGGKAVEESTTADADGVGDMNETGKWPEKLEDIVPIAVRGRDGHGNITIDVSYAFTVKGSNEQRFLSVVNLGRDGWYFKADVLCQCGRTFFGGENKTPKVFVSWVEQFIRQIAYGPDKLYRRQLRPHEPAGTLPYPTSRLTCILSVNPKGFTLETVLKKFESDLKRMFSDGKFPAHMMVRYMASESSALYNGFMMGNYRAPPNKGNPFVDENELKEQVKTDFEKTFRNGFGTVTHNMKLDRFLPDIAIKKFVESLGYSNFDEMNPDERANLYRSGLCPEWSQIKTEQISGGFV